MMAKPVEHWMNESNVRGEFWATANELGLDKEQVYEALGVKSVHDYPGTSKEAIAALYAFGMFEGRSKPVEQPELFEDNELEYEDMEPEPEDDVPAPKDSTGPSEVDPDAIYRMVATQPEAPVVVWTKFIDQRGYLWSFTVRPGLPGEVLTELNRSAIRQMDNFHKAAKAYNWVPEGGYLPAPTRQSEQELADPPRGKPVGPAQPDPAPTDGMIRVIKQGTAALKSIIVVDGKVEYEVDGFRYPIKDSRGLETVDKVFDESAASWLPSTLGPGTRYNGTGAMVDWEQIEKKGKNYWNVVRVWAA